MPKLNRGNPIKLSIRMSVRAKNNASIAAKKLGISVGGVILFELAKFLKNPPSLEHIQELESVITLERNHFVMTVNEGIMERVNNLAEDYNMKKNILIGYIISEHFENMQGLDDGNETEPKKLMVQVNETLKKKMMEYSEKHYIPFSGLVAYSVLEGPYEGLPFYQDNEFEKFYTNVPAYVGDMVKDLSEEMAVREHFYTALCLYKQFMTPEGRFFE